MDYSILQAKLFAKHSNVLIHQQSVARLGTLFYQLKKDKDDTVK